MMFVTNTLAYRRVGLITAVKGFIVHAHEVLKFLGIIKRLVEDGAARFGRIKQIWANFHLNAKSKAT